MLFTELTVHLFERTLSAAEVRTAVDALLDPAADAELKAAFLHKLHQRGETADEIAWFAEAMLAYAVNPAIDPAKLPGPMIDVCGTGGDGLNFFNISTAVTFVLAAGGACVAKHGNRAVTSRSGAADVLEALGVRIQLTPAEARERLARDGIAFFYAPDYHPSFQAIAAVRRALGGRKERTIFNLLGPLLNPARPPFQMTGVFSPAHLRSYAEVFGRLGRQRAWALHGEVPGGGMDEVSPLGPTFVVSCEEGRIAERTILPADFGLAPVDPAELRGGDARENAQILTGILRGEVEGARRDIVLINAAAAFVVCGLAADLTAGFERALHQITSGAAWRNVEAARA